MKLATLLFVSLLLSASMARADDAPSGTAQKSDGSAQPSASSDNGSAVPDAGDKAAPDAGDKVAPAPTNTPIKPPAITPSIVLTPGAATMSPEEAKVAAELNRIRERAKQIDPKEKEMSEKSLKETAAQVDASSAKKEKVEVAGRLAAEFGGIPELYLGEHDRLKTGWGELAIAHTLLAGAKTTVTIDQLFDLRQEGLGWGQIAHGLDLNVGEFTRTAQAKGRAATGAPGSGAKSETVEAKADMGASAAKGAKAKSGSDAKRDASSSPDPNPAAATPHGKSGK
jgi:hypothetical protein